MTRLAMATLLGNLGHLALASQSQVPMRVGDCVKATTALEFFFKDEGEYERTHSITPGQHGVLLNIDSAWNEPSNVEFLDKQTREPVVSGAVFFHQFARVPWLQGQVKNSNEDKCMTVKDARNGYQPVVKMAPCPAIQTDREKWTQQFSFNYHECGARPIRSTADPSKCVDAVHPTKVLLTDCSGVDSQKFLFRCETDATAEIQGCYIQAMGGRKDMCLWWDETSADATDLQIRSCNSDAAATTPANDGATRHFKPKPRGNPADLQTRPNTAPASVTVPASV